MALHITLLRYFYNIIIFLIIFMYDILINLRNIMSMNTLYYQHEYR